MSQLSPPEWYGADGTDSPTQKAAPAASSMHAWLLDTDKETNSRSPGTVSGSGRVVFTSRSSRQGGAWLLWHKQPGHPLSAPGFKPECIQTELTPYEQIGCFSSRAWRQRQHGVVCKAGRSAAAGGMWRQQGRAALPTPQLLAHPVSALLLRLPGQLPRTLAGTASREGLARLLTACLQTLLSRHTDAFIHRGALQRYSHQGFAAAAAPPPF